MEKKLLLNQPLLSAYPEYGVLFSFIDLSDIASSNWVYSSFIHIYTLDISELGHFFTAFQEHVDLSLVIPTLQYKKISNTSLIKMYNDSIINGIMKGIDDSCGITMLIDRNCIEIFRKHTRKHNFHMTLFYGYNIEKEIFYVYDHSPLTGKFESMEYKFCEVQLSIIRTLDRGYNLEFTSIHRVKNSSFILDIKQLKSDFIFYLNSFSMKLDFASHFKTINKIESNNDKVKYHNLGIYDHLNDLLEEKEGSQIFDLRSFYLYYEHKLIMLERMKFFKEQNITYNSSENIIIADKMLEKSKVILNLSIKYRLLKQYEQKNHISKKISVLLNENMTDEIVLINKVIDGLDGYEQRKNGDILC